MTPVLRDAAVLVPEIVLAVGAMTLLVVGVFLGDRAQHYLSRLAILVLVVAGACAYFFTPSGHNEAFGGAFVLDDYARFVKVLVTAGSALVLVMAQSFLVREKMARFEFPILVLLSTLGMTVMVSANNFITLYLGLELQSLALYVLAAFNRDSLKSTEAGLKYFVLGALSSGMMLYGISLIYGFTGSTAFSVVAHTVAGLGSSVGLVFGLVFLASGLAFKISAVPFHMWTPDVYEGAPTPVTALFSSAPKIAAMALFVRVLVVPFPTILGEWQQIIVFMALLSMILGAVAAIGQTNIKRLMAYSSIGHMGYALVGLAAGTAVGVQGVLIYLTIYLITNIGVFVCILAMRRGTVMIEDISELAGLAQRQPAFAFAMAMLMFSLAGIPPLAGFFAKFYVFLAAVNAGLYSLAVIGVLASVVGAYYYLRIVKIMYFDEPAPAFEGRMGADLAVVLGGVSVVTLFFVLGAAPLVAAARVAAATLFP